MGVFDTMRSNTAKPEKETIRFGQEFIQGFETGMLLTREMSDQIKDYECEEPVRSVMGKTIANQWSAVAAILGHYIKTPLAIAVTASYKDIFPLLLDMYGVTQLGYQDDEFCRGLLFSSKGIQILEYLGNALMESDEWLASHENQSVTYKKLNLPKPLPGNKF